MSTGILITYIMGTFIDWHVLSKICCGIAAIVFVAVVTFPESPVWLQSRKRYRAAQRSAEWLHLEGFGADHQRQIEEKMNEIEGRSVLVTPKFVAQK
jgi:facilitated trehalose transporter